MTHHARRNSLAAPLLCFFVLICTALSSFVGKAVVSQTGRSQSPTGDRRAGADSELKQGVCAFRAHDYAIAQQHFEKAQELDPSQKKLPIFIARAVDEQFNQNVSEEKGKRAIGAYDQIIARNQNNPNAVDQALALKANVYSRLTNVNPDKAKEYFALYRETEEKIANLPWATMATRSGVYYLLGTSYWKESYDMNAGYISRNQPIPPNILEKMKPLVQKAHECLQKAISVNPNEANAWYYEKLVYIEEIKCAPSRTDELSKKAMEMQDKYTAMQKQQRQEALSSPDLQIKKEVEDPEQEKREINDFIETGNYKREPRIDLETLLPFDSLALLPVPPDDDASKYEAERQAKRMAKLAWKPFAPATEEFSVSMPSPVDQSGGIYSAHSEAIAFLIIPSQRPLPPITSTDEGFAVLATSALATAKAFDRIGRSDETGYEVSLVRRLSLNGHPGAQYRLKWTEYCGKTVSRILRVYAANEHIYALCVYPIPGEGNDEVWDGDEDDPRVSMFLRSFTIRAQSQTLPGPQKGNAPVVLASNQRHPSDSVVDEGRVY